MIAPQENIGPLKPERENRPGGGVMPYKRKPALAVAIARDIQETGSLGIAAPLHGVSRPWCEKWAHEDPRVASLFARALARFLRDKVRRVVECKDAVLAQSYRFILARRCPDYREPKSAIEDALNRAVNSVRFVVEKPPADRVGATARKASES